MSQPDIEKRKKKRRRSARIYISNAHPLPSPEQLAALVDQFPSDEDDDGPTPAHTEAAARTRKAVTGMAADGLPFPDRVSPPIGPGHAAYGTGDHGAARGTTDPMNVPGPRELAYRHPDMRQGTTNAVPLFTMTTVNGDNQNGDRDIIFGAGRVSARRLDAAAATGLASAPGNPASRRMDHIAPTSALPANGSHGLADPSCPPTGAMKSSEARAYLAAEFRRQMGQ